MFNDVRRLKTAKIEGGIYGPPPRTESSTFFGGRNRVKAMKKSEKMSYTNAIKSSMKETNKQFIGKCQKHSVQKTFLTL